MIEVGRSRRQPALAVAATVAVVVPLAILFVALLGRRWLPIGDEAAILYRTAQVGTAQTPLTGSYSTRGWAHPGPFGFYLLAPPYRILGGRPIALFQAAVVWNVAVVALVGYLGWRRRRLAGTVTVMAATATLIVGLRPEVLSSFWNPYLPLLVYLAFLLAMWSVGERDWVLLPVAAGLASVIVQLHVGYLPLVAGASVVGAVLVSLRRSDGAPRTWPGRRLLAATGVVVGVVWLAPVVDLVRRGRDGNLRLLGRYFNDTDGASIGLGDGAGLLSGHVRPGGPWMGGRERLVFLDVQPESLWSLVALVLLLVGVVVALVRRRRPHVLPALALSQLAAGVVAAMRVEPPILSYLIVWMLPLATFAWMALGVSAADLLGGREPRTEARTRAAPLRTVALAALAVILVVQAGRAGAAARDPALPRTQHAAAVRSLVAQLDEQLPDGAVVRIEGVGDDLNEAWVGVVYGLDRAGVDFRTGDGKRGVKWGPEHVWKRGTPVHVVLTVATHVPGDYEDAVARCDEDDDLERIATWDGLDPAERRRLGELQLANLVAEGDLPDAEAAELERLIASSFRMVVFGGSEVCRA